MSIQITGGRLAFSHRFCNLIESCTTLGEVEKTLLEYIPTMHVYRSPNRIIGYWQSYPVSITVIITYC